jgi:hypothetical protein
MHGRGVLKQLRPVERILLEGEWLHGVFQPLANEPSVESSEAGATDTAVSNTDNSCGTSHTSLSVQDHLHVTDSMAQLSVTKSDSGDDSEGPRNGT